MSLNYRMHRPRDRWQVYDLGVDGISLVANYRTQFNKIIRTDSYDTLVVRLKSQRPTSPRPRRSRPTRRAVTGTIEGVIGSGRAIADGHALAARGTALLRPPGADRHRGRRPRRARRRVRGTFPDPRDLQVPPAPAPTAVRHALQEHRRGLRPARGHRRGRAEPGRRDLHGLRAAPRRRPPRRRARDGARQLSNRRNPPRRARAALPAARHAARHASDGRQPGGPARWLRPHSDARPAG